MISKNFELRGRKSSWKKPLKQKACRSLSPRDSRAPLRASRSLSFGSVSSVLSVVKSPSLLSDSHFELRTSNLPSPFHCPFRSKSKIDVQKSKMSTFTLRSRWFTLRSRYFTLFYAISRYFYGGGRGHSSAPRQWPISDLSIFSRFNSATLRISTFALRFLRGLLSKLCIFPTWNLELRLSTRVLG
jgi:hypothetical protein